MICPHCSTAVKCNWKYTDTFRTKPENYGREIQFSTCPNCDEPLIYLLSGYYHYNDDVGCRMMIPDFNKLIYPITPDNVTLEDVPNEYCEDYNEAKRVLPISSKASAALTRRLLQTILREEYKIKDKSLIQEIEKFIHLDGIPSHLTGAVDAIRNIGNFAAHPIEDKSTGEIVPVEQGEAEWLIEIIEALFDFTFIQPKKLERRRLELDTKLEQVGKPPMKQIGL